MGWIGKAVAVATVMTACLTAASAPTTAEAQTSSAACKRACSTTYTACQKRAINGETCLRRWLACKKKCSARAAAPATTPR